MLYSWGLVPEIRIADFRDSYTDHTDTSQFCREAVHFNLISTFIVDAFKA